MLYNAEHYPDPTAHSAIKHIQQTMPLKYIIQGDPRTKKNSQRILYQGTPCRLCHKGKTPFIMPSKAFKDYEQKALWQLTPKPIQPIQQAVNVKCEFYMKTKRIVDLNNLLESICDILVASRILKDDNSNIVASHDGSRVLYDRTNPRVEITISQIDLHTAVELKGKE